MITERKEFGKIEILPDGQIQLREDTVIERDGIEITKLYHRSVLEPNDDKNHSDAIVDSILKLIWTQEVIDKYKLKKDKIKDLA